MKRFLILGVASLLVMGCRGNETPPAPAPEPEPPPPIEWSADVQAVADGNNQFAFDLYAKLIEEEKGNLFFSPYSVHAALAMTASGANGTTREQMLKVLHLPADEQKFLASGDLSRYYAHPRQHVELSIANAIWGKKGYGWSPDWLALQKARFGSELHEADFFGNPDTERQRINQWVEEKTRKRIQELIPSGKITTATVQVLVNAIYFKGNWATQFDPKRTHDELFHLADDSRVTVPMMNGKVKCGFAREADGLSMVELPYKGGELSMVVLLPRFPNGIPALEKSLNSATLARWLGMMSEYTEFEVSMPRFRVESSLSLLDHLKALGMTGSDFTRMAPGSTEPITAVLHKGFVDVNEEGTEAAAATAVIRGKSADPLPFRAEHPFLFLIRDVKRGTILFMGRVMNPKK